MKQVIASRKNIAVEQRRAVPVTEGGDGFRTVPDGAIFGDVELIIDADEILRTLGSQAIMSKGKKAICLSGLVTVRATNIRRHPGQ